MEIVNQILDYVIEGLCTDISKILSTISGDVNVTLVTK